MKRRRWIGQAARERVLAGGPLAKSRPTETLESYREIKRDLYRVAQGRCEACGATVGVMDPEHAIPRSKGAIGVSTLENLWLSCRVCHNQKTSAYVQGRLKPIPLGQGRFRFELWYGKNREAAVLSRAWENPARLT